MFSPTVHNLVWPIDDDNKQPLTSVSVNLLTMGQQRQLTEQHKGQEKSLVRACISASTGLTLTELSRFVTPDFSSIQTSVLGLMEISAAKLLADNAPLPAHTSEVSLLVPINGDDGQQKMHYTLRPPTVATTDLMLTHTDEWERTLFISASCSGFSHDELKRLSLPDWNLLQERLIDFLDKPADFFR